MTSGTKSRNQELASQLPDNWEQSNEIPDREPEEPEEPEEMTKEEEVKKKLDPEDLMVNRDEDGEVQPIEVPLVMHPSKEGTVKIKPLTGRDEKDFSMMQVDYKEKIESGAYQQRGDYDFNEAGKHVGYDGISLRQIKKLINNHLVEPDLPHFDTISDMLDNLRESIMMSLFFTIKIYGLGMSMDSEDDVVDRLSDKKKY